MLQLAGKCSSIESGIEIAKQKLVGGECFGKFIEMVNIQGGDSSVIKDLNKYQKSKFSHDIKAAQSGYITSMEAIGFGHASVNLGCGRKAVHHGIDYSSGIILEKKPGDELSKGDVICRIFGESESKIEHAVKRIEKSITISKNPPLIRSKIIEVID
jgi:pyrimidine-nucleoside phosphorylase